MSIVLALGVKAALCGALNTASMQLLDPHLYSPSLQYEHFVVPGRYSVAASLSARIGERGDFHSASFSTGAEGRWWLSRQECSKEEGRAGLFLSGRLDLSTHRLRDDTGESVGASVVLGESVGIGQRFVFFDKVELTPSVSVGLHTDIEREGRLPPQTYWLPMVGMTLGWVF